ncbi:RNA polymerase sigma factor [Dyadobacter psychrotolerans]|uniref:Sigma-70 family RNA polymerase sigma factor n=1 Tax=Dyadobacter psychrotolerans TaxID=2541721 RepID=A0A4R5DTR8_9BACT|nr:sigma-70 family RNA polymerase sigma factor [Dyadobacter psychrotolerans]TDE17177.1 sigma-70 family RNA polymerase sigma factor [Dyadobacter psychrotolerans]
MVINQSSDNDLFLWNGLKQGDSNAFSSLYSRYFPVLFEYGFHLQSDREIVRDAIQNLFVSLWKFRQKLSDTDSIRFYLFRCLRREILKELNRIQKSFYTDDFNQEESAEQKWICTESFKRNQETLDVALKSLSRRQSQVIHLRYFKELDVDKISLLMGITAHAVYKLIYRAIATLQKSFQLFETSVL